MMRYHLRIAMVRYPAMLWRPLYSKPSIGVMIPFFSARPLVFVLALCSTLFLAGSYTLTYEDPWASDSLIVTLWARQPMLKNPVALSHAPDGRLFVTEANRRKSTDLDVRNMKGLRPVPWPALDYSLDSVEQRRQLLREYLDPANGMRHNWLEDYDGDGVKDWRDLRVKSERINLLEDTDGDGAADRATVFAEGFNTEITGTAGGVLWHDDHVYLAVIPNLWRMKDTDGDGVADERDILQSGMGVHIGQGGHDLHGLTPGPDGRIYWSIGDRGINLTTPDGVHHYYPNQGLVMRSDPDGSRFEVFAHGLRNCQELAFDDYGNLFCVDNDGDFEGERERLVYVTPGSDTGWRINWQYNHTNRWAADQRLPRYNPWMDESLSVPHFAEQAAYITPTLGNYSDGPAGFTRNPGTALSEAYEGHFFLTQFPGQLITSFQLEPAGASFEMVNESTFHEGFMATGLSFSPDGALFVADWAGDWNPTEDGGIFRIDVPEDHRHPLRDSTHALIRDGVSAFSDAGLVELLAYPDQRVRLDAQFELVDRHAFNILTFTALDRQQARLARIHSLWGLGQLYRSSDVQEGISLRPLLYDPDDHIRMQACKLVTEAPHLFDWYLGELTALLEDDNPRVQFHAALALGALRREVSFLPLIELLERNDNADPFLRHAAVSALADIGKIDLLLRAENHPSSAVRRALVVALRRLEAPAVTSFLDDEDPLVVLEAARAIHDDFGIPDALPDLAALLIETPHYENEALMRRILNANLRVGGSAQLDAVLAFAADETYPVHLRSEALDVAHTWQNPPVLDRVERRYRALPERDKAGILPVIRNHLPALLAVQSGALKSSVFSLVNLYGIELDARDLQRLLADESRSASERLEALELLAAQSRQRRKAFRTAFGSDNDALRTQALRFAATIDEDRALDRIETVLNESESLQERQAAYDVLGRLNSPRAAGVLEPWISRLAEGQVAPAERLDLYMAARTYDRFSQLLDALGNGAYAPKFEFALEGGNAERGSRIFHTDGAAQCIRCHAVGGEGSNVGPDMQGVGSRYDRQYLLESLIDPSKAIGEGYQGPVSIMPPMDALLEPGEIRDLVEYLSTL